MDNRMDEPPSAVGEGRAARKKTRQRSMSLMTLSFSDRATERAFLDHKQTRAEVSRSPAIPWAPSLEYGREFASLHVMELFFVAPVLISEGISRASAAVSAVLSIPAIVSAIFLVVLSLRGVSRANAPLWKLQSLCTFTAAACLIAVTAIYPHLRSSLYGEVWWEAKATGAEGNQQPLDIEPKFAGDVYRAAGVFSALGSMFFIAPATLMTQMPFIACVAIVTATSWSMSVTLLLRWPGDPLQKLSPVVAMLFSGVLALASMYSTEFLNREEYLSMKELARQKRVVRFERDKFARMLDNKMPRAMAERVMQRRSVGDGKLQCAHVAVCHPFAAVMFASIDGFPDAKDPRTVISKFSELYLRIDGECERMGCTFVKTIGNTAMMASGLNITDKNGDSACPRDTCSTPTSVKGDVVMRAAALAVRVQETVARFSGENGINLTCRIGMDAGAVVAGVLGRDKPTYDCWSDTVNTASRLVQLANGGTILATPVVAERLFLSFAVRARTVTAKGLGAIDAMELTNPDTENSLLAQFLALHPPSLSRGSTPASENQTDLFFESFHESDSEDATESRSFEGTVERKLQKRMTPIGRLFLVFRESEIAFQRSYKLHGFPYLKTMQWALLLATALFLSLDYATPSFRGQYRVILWHYPAYAITGLMLGFVSGKEYVSIASQIILSCNHLVQMLLFILEHHLGVCQHHYAFGFMTYLFVAHLWFRVSFAIASVTSVLMMAVHTTLTVVLREPGWQSSLLTSWFTFTLLLYSHHNYGLNSRANWMAARCIEREKLKVSREREASLNLLLAMIPMSIFKRLTSEPHLVIAERIPEATIVFADVINFTKMSHGMPATRLVRLLGDLFQWMDAVTEQHGFTRLKTVGDAYIASGNVDKRLTNHADRGLELAIALLRELPEFNSTRRDEDHGAIKLRIGVHTCWVICGVMRLRHLFFDCWGATLRVTEALELSARENGICTSEATMSVVSSELRARARAFPASPVAVGSQLVNAYHLDPSSWE